MVVSLGATTTWLISAYGIEKSTTFSLSGLMLNPEAPMSHLPDGTDRRMESKVLVLNCTLQPMSLQTARTMSMSIPAYSWPTW